MNHSTILKLISDNGSGRVFIVLQECGEYQESATQIAKQLADKCRCVHLELSQDLVNDWQAGSEDIIKKIEELGIRQVSLVGISSAGTVAQNICLTNPKLVRSIILFDCATRSHPSNFDLLVDWLESKLPMGLPFRSKNKGFDAKPFLQRLRCPVLIINTPTASQHIKNESKIMHQRIPTSWLLESGDQELIVKEILEFQEVAAKCPQKVRRAA